MLIVLALLCLLLWGTDRFTHILLGYVTGNWPVVRLVQGQWNISNEYEQQIYMKC